MEMLIVFLLFPVAFGIAARYFWKDTYTWPEFACSIAISAVMMGAVYGISVYTEMADTEILNGEVVSKVRDHDTYTESYDCNCRTVTRGSGDSEYTTTECDTCYREHYTVDWYANTTVGRIRFDYKDSTSSSVYNTPDPKAYVDCYVGEPASVTGSFTNYVKAVPTSLFNTAVANQMYSDKVPAYPKVHSFYKVNRVINVDSTVNSAILTELDKLLDEHLRVLGPTKQANIIAIFTSIKDPSYRYAVENTWIGGKKNDVVLFFGTEGDTIVWTDVMTWALNSGNEFMVAEMKRKLAEIGSVDAEKIASVTENLVDALYVRPKMADYEYLKNDIKPSNTALAICWVISVFGTLLLTWIFHRHSNLGRTRYGSYHSRYRR